jgi:23S rRNA pseudouridine1911/1915/1917 synthase
MQGSAGAAVVSERIRFTVSDEDAGRLDHFLTGRLPEFSRSRLQTIIRDGAVQIDGAPAQKTGQQIEAGALVEIDLPPIRPAAVEPESIPLDVVFENGDVLIVDKPAGMVVHPSAGHSSGTLVNAALAHAPDITGIGGEIRPGIVHRLDKDTSGLILLAKNDLTHRFLQAQFKNRTVEKVYLALVDGQPATPEGRIEAAIGRDTRNRKKMSIVPPNRGREAVTEYHTLETFRDHTLLEVHPVTGRTHQIRLHLAFIGCPVAGDTIYGHKKATLKIKRHFLHAARIRVRLPGEAEPRLFEAPLPENLANLLEDLRRKRTAD